ncbi:MAG: nucleotidyl transferase AbiEii/AbiGii toxin family protein [Deltaproteobacteria bacterium]|nr:nucleotidyl transferase AbiEii/AbiGii toxin family protein [Deltaproteobacteria bacterium]
MELDYIQIFKELNKFGIDYLVVGGLAVNFYGIPRMTYDIDLMIFPEPDNILKMVEKLKTWGYKTKVPVDPRDLADEAQRKRWIKEKGMKAMSFYSDESPLAEIDLLFDLAIPYVDLKKRAVSFELEGEKIPTISIHDLIELKKQAGRKQDLSDVAHLRLILEDLE